MRNIKEEINRIKSLFNEERLYGNLINEQPFATDTNSDGNIDEPEAINFLKSLDYSVKKLSDEDNSVAGFCYSKDIIKNIYTKYKLNFKDSSVSTEIHSSGGMCYISSVRKSFVAGVFNINKLVFWDNQYISFFVSLELPIDLSTAENFKKTFESLDVTSPIGVLVKGNEAIGKDDNTTKVQWLRYEARIDGSYENYSNLKFLDFWDADGKKMKLYAPLVNKIQTEGYNPLTDPSDITSAREYGTGLDLTSIITTGLGIGETGTVNDLFDKLTT